jgi:O-6-methylguanine DNA methyltransferase
VAPGRDLADGGEDPAIPVRAITQVEGETLQRAEVAGEECLERRERLTQVGHRRRAGRGVRELERAVAALEAFLDGRPAGLEGLPLDMADRGAWDRAVLGAVRGLGWGQVASYGGIATAIGRRGAARAVGGAVGRNPIGLAIPCHRVIAGDGTIGGYGGDWFGGRDALLAIKRDLLALEGVSLPVGLRPS